MKAVLRLSEIRHPKTPGNLFIPAQLLIHDETNGFLGNFGSDGFTVVKFKVLQEGENPPALEQSLPEVDLHYHAYAHAARFPTDATGRIVVIPIKLRVDTARSLTSVQTNSDTELAVMVRPLFCVTRQTNSDDVKQVSYHDIGYTEKTCHESQRYGHDVYVNARLIQLEVFVKKVDSQPFGDKWYPPTETVNQNGVVDAPYESATQPVILNKGD